MGLRGLPFEKLEFPFAKGLNQKADPRLTQEPELVRALDVDFDNLGGLRLRYPYSSIGASIFGGGTISGCRRVYQCGSELLLFTSDTLYSWNAALSKWVSRGTHLAVKVQEQPVFVTTGDQVNCDRAELSNTIVYAWVDNGAVYAAAVDKTTGSVITGPTAISSAVSRPRLVATTTKILLFTVTSGPDLKVRAIDPTDPATGFASAATSVITSASGFNSYYDVVANVGVDGAVFASRHNPTTSYDVGTVSAALAVSTSTKARTCDGAIGLSVASTGVVQIIRGNGTNVQGDLLTSALVDSTTGQAVGTIAAGTVTQIACAHRSVQNSSAYRCYAFWDTAEVTTSTDFTTKYNWVDTAGTLGTQATFVHRLAVASRAFDYNGSVYLHLAFAGATTFSGTGISSVFPAQVQNTYFLYRDDATMQAKVAATRAGGFSAVTGHLPGVALTSGTTGYSWCATERRIVPFGENAAGYSDRGPRDVTVTFDSNEARRVAKIGATLYVSGGQILQYDGQQLTECGFDVFPWSFGAIDAAGGSVATGTYGLKSTWRWDNARGERDRSTTSAVGTCSVTGGRLNVPSGVPLYTTRKTGVAVEIWRTAVSPPGDAPFYLTTGQDPATTSGSNCYIANDTTLANLASWNDDFADSTLTTKESNPENDGVLENLAPPAATLIVANDTRLFLAGVAGDPHRVLYSKQREAGSVAAFHDNLAVDIPEPGGDITGLAFFERVLVVFRETAIYALDGQGFDNTGQGQNYEPRQIAADVGAVNQESIVWTPHGLMFKSSKGWQLMRAPQLGATEYIGGPVRDYDTDTIYAAHVVEDQHQVRIMTSARMLVFDYLAGNWAEWSISDGLHACVWNGTHHYLATAAVKAQQTSYSSADYGWDVEMLVHLGGLQGFARCRKIMVLGEVRGSGSIRVRVGDYAEGTYWDDKTWTISPTTAGSELNFHHGPSRQQQKAFRIRLTSHTTAGEKPQLSALTLEVGIKPGVFRHLPAAQRQ